MAPLICNLFLDYVCCGASTSLHGEPATLDRDQREEEAALDPPPPSVSIATYCPWLERNVNYCRCLFSMIHLFPMMEVTTNDLNTVFCSLTQLTVPFSMK